MSLSMPSHQVQELIAGYVLGDLSPDETVRFEQLMAEHPELIRDIAAVQQALEMSYAPPEVAPPASLRDRVLVAHGAIVPGQAALSPPSAAPHTARHPFSQRRIVWGRAAGVAAAAIIVALGVANYRLWQTLQALQTASSDEPPLTYTLQGTEAAQNATANVVVDPTTLQARVTVEDLPPLPPGKVYVLWTVVGRNAPFTTDAKGAILTQVFRVDEQGNFSGTVAVPVAYQIADRVTRLAVTIEDAAAPQAHVGVMTLSTPLS